MAYAPAGPRGGEEFDVAAAIGTAPGALLFVHEVSRNTAPLIGAFDKFGLELALLGFSGHAIRLAADRTEAEAASSRQSKALRMHAPLLVSVDGAEGPGGYALNRRCTLTLVLCKDGKVQRSVALTDAGRQDIPQLRTWLEEVAGKLPEDEAALRALLAERLPRDAARLRLLATELAVALRRAPPTTESRPAEMAARNDEITGLVRRVIRPDADQTALDQAFSALDAAVGKDRGKQAQAVEVLQRIIKLGYGTEDARRRAQAWIDAKSGR